MNREALNKNIDETMAKSIISMVIKNDPTDEILKGFNEVCDHLYTMTDDELTILDQGLKMLVALDPLWVNKKEQNKFMDIIKMMQEVIDLLWKEHE